MQKRETVFRVDYNPSDVLYDYGMILTAEMLNLCLQKEVKLHFVARVI